MLQRGCMLRAFVSALASMLMLYGCAGNRQPAPVVDRAPPAAKPAAGVKPTAAPAQAARELDPRPESYTVKPGDTLYMIALDNGLDYKELAEWNNLSNPNVIRVGQQLRLKPPASTVVTTPLQTPPAAAGKPVTASAASPAADGVVTQPKALKVPYSEQALAQWSGAAPAKPVTPAVAKADAPRPPEKPAAGADDDEKVEWGWPVSGKVVSAFNEAANLKGIGIVGKLGQQVLASAPGKVLYSGDGIRGYGKLVIIKHNKVFLSVYAHNNQLTVKEGQNVVKGQKIAEMGSSDSDQVKLHFEIRRFGKPVDPVKLLPDAPV